jgi:predicted RNase H-like nuclease
VRVLGVDGCKDGWAVVAIEDGRVSDTLVVESIADLVDDPATVIAIDIPMGEVAPTGRRAEGEARRFLPGRASTIFTPPPLVACGATSYDEARAITRSIRGSSISHQAWGLRRAMLDARPHWCADPIRLRESHPECSFRAMAGKVVKTKKRTPAGAEDRTALLHSHGIELGALAERRWGTDVIDAAAIAWTADRIARGEGFSLPSPPERDADGRPVAIWV